MQGNMNEPAIDCWQRNLAVCLFGAFTTVFAMTLILPFLPVYIGQLGVSGHAAIVQWSGIAYAATFVTAGLVAPLWGCLATATVASPCWSEPAWEWRSPCC